VHVAQQDGILSLEFIYIGCKLFRVAFHVAFNLSKCHLIDVTYTCAVVQRCNRPARELKGLRIPS